MQRQWYLIDDEGIHPVRRGGEPENFWELFDREGEEAPWPEFSQLVIDASAGRVMEGLLGTAGDLGVVVEEVTNRPECWPGSILLAESGSMTILGEPGVESDERVLALEWSEELIAQLRADGAFFGYDPAAGTLFLTLFREGRLEFAWCDSLLPGPSYAMVFDESGQCRDEDPRRFALKRLGMPETSPLLDRHRFFLAELERIGLDRVRPELEDFPIAAAISAAILPSAESGGF